MALKRLIIDGYGQIELNQVAWPRDGRIEAQCALDSTDFADVSAENGMILAVDNIKRVVKFVTEDTVSALLPCAINYSTEHIYDERTPGLKNFKLDKDDVYPRLGYLSIGDKFTTNTICYDDETYSDEETLMEALEAIEEAELYGIPSNKGAIQIVDANGVDEEARIVLKVIKKTTMPDGQVAVKFQVVRA